MTIGLMKELQKRREQCRIESHHSFRGSNRPGRADVSKYLDIYIYLEILCGFMDRGGFVATTICRSR